MSILQRIFGWKMFYEMLKLIISVDDYKTHLNDPCCVVMVFMNGLNSNFLFIYKICSDLFSKIKI